MNAPNHSDLYQGLGRLEGTTASMETRLDKIEEVLERIDKRLAGLEEKEHQRKGAIYALMLFSGFIGGLVSKFGAAIFGAH